jgi:hypothetical protein
MKTILPVLIGLIAFFTRVVCAGTGTVTFDFNTTVRYGSPFVFGGCKYPDKVQQDDFYPKLKESGITFLRADFYFQLIIPTNKCASVADYKNNVNGIQNPDKWEYGHLFWIDSSRKYGFKTFIVTVYTPPWLSCSGNYKGVPKDWSIWEDIVKKVYSRYKMRVDWVETWNEIEYWCDLTGSPYTNKEDFLADHFYHTVKAIREAGGTIPTGGFAFAEDHTEMFKSVLQKLGRIESEQRCFCGRVELHDGLGSAARRTLQCQGDWLCRKIIGLLHQERGQRRLLQYVSQRHAGAGHGWRHHFTRLLHDQWKYDATTAVLSVQNPFQPAGIGQRRVSGEGCFQPEGRGCLLRGEFRWPKCRLHRQLF